MIRERPPCTIYEQKVLYGMCVYGTIGHCAYMYWIAGLFFFKGIPFLSFCYCIASLIYVDSSITIIPHNYTIITVVLAGSPLAGRG